MNRLFSITLILSPMVAAHSPKELDQVMVTAAPLERTAEDVIAPAEVIRGAQLDRRQSNTLGETLDGLAGVANTAFGAGAGRPIIRGLDGGRVLILEDGSASMDASALSPDHAVSVDPFLAEQVEVLKGPATLLYGSGAIGGIVNVLNGRMHTRTVEAGVRGRALIGFDSVANLRSGAAKLDIAGEQGLVFHADAAYRDADDYKIPGSASAADIVNSDGRVGSTDFSSRGASAGLSYIGDSAYLGLALSQFDSLYGIPEVESSTEDLAVALAKGGGDEGVRIDLAQTRFDAEAGLALGAPGWDELTLRLARNDYRHAELEGDDIGTTFDNQQTDARLGLRHSLLAASSGLVGVSFSDRDLEAVGEEAFLPPSNTQATGLYAVQHFDGEIWHLDAGARVERNRIDVRAQAPDRSFDLTSLSLAFAYELDAQQRLSINLDRAQRAPAPEELYADGPHVATQAFELGDIDLRRETSRQVELGWRYTDDAWQIQASAYLNRFDDFIYLAATEAVEDGLPVYQWSQADAQFHGLELSASYRFAETDIGQFALETVADSVTARLRDGEALPRIPPRRLSLGLNWDHAAWAARIGARYHARQDRIATFETPTPGYTLIEADLSRSFALGDIGLEAYLKGRNLSDRLARVHNSFLKDVAPLPGRNFELGLRLDF